LRIAGSNHKEEEKEKKKKAQLIPTYENKRHRSHPRIHTVTR
jgi:hypothetical protein